MEVNTGKPTLKVYDRTTILLTKKQHAIIIQLVCPMDPVIPSQQVMCSTPLCRCQRRVQSCRTCGSIWIQIDSYWWASALFTHRWCRPERTAALCVFTEPREASDPPFERSVGRTGGFRVEWYTVLDYCPWPPSTFVSNVFEVGARLQIPSEEVRLEV